MPVYLQKVKQAVAEEERVVIEKLGLNRPDNGGVPPGYKVLSDAERLDILKKLQERKKELDAQHSKLPLHSVTDGQRRRADELEKHLREAEVAIQQFSRPRVLVRL